MRTAEQKQRQGFILEGFTNTYISLTHPHFAQYPTEWAQNIEKTRYDNYFLDRCFASSQETKIVMDIIANGLIGQDVVDRDNAEVASYMFQELYKHNLTIRKHINFVFGNYPNGIKQLANGDSLEALLFSKRIIEEQTGQTPYLIDDIKAVRKSRPSLAPDVRATDLRSIHQFNEEHSQDDTETHGDSFRP